jgi:hypothetical protein
MKKLSKFDIGMIIAFVVVALLGGAGWWWLSGELETAQGEAQNAAGQFDTYSKKEVYLPTRSNLTTLQNNISLMTAQLDPLVKSTLQSPKNGLADIQQLDTVAWKHSLDDEVSRLNAAAKTHGISVPDGFYYGFSRYLNTNPNQDATTVLEKQQLAIGAISDILINAPVRSIVTVARTYEEDGDAASSPGLPSRSGQAGGSQLGGHSVDSPGGVYTAYPFEFEFDADTESLRAVVNGLMKADYVFVIRSVMVQNERLDSPKTTDLPQMAGVNGDSQPSLINSSPGAVAATQPVPTVGLQYLFGDEALHVRMRIDLIDWHGIAQTTAPTAGNGRGAHPGRGNNGGGAGGPGGNGSGGANQ